MVPVCDQKTLPTHSTVTLFLERCEQMSTHPYRDPTTDQSNKHRQSPTWWTNELIGVTYRSSDDSKASLEAHLSRGDSSQKLELWGSPNDLQAAQQTGAFPLLNRTCCFNLGERGTLWSCYVSGTCWDLEVVFFLNLIIRGNCSTIGTVIFPRTLSSIRFLAVAKVICLLNPLLPLRWL